MCGPQRCSALLVCRTVVRAGFATWRMFTSEQSKSPSEGFKLRQSRERFALRGLCWLGVATAPILRVRLATQNCFGPTGAVISTDAHAVGRRVLAWRICCAAGRRAELGDIS